MSADVLVSVQASPRDRDSWLALATEVESRGFQGLYAGDHPGSAASPFVALASAAAVTERIRLGTCVLNAGLWEPLTLANQVATLDVVSGGRAVLGVGAGHTPQEWISTGRSFPTSGERIEHMVELVETTTALLGGRTVSHRGRHFTLADAMLADPRPLQSRIPLLVGGNATRLLKFAAQHADIVGVTGAGRTLSDGHHHEVDWTPSGLARIAKTIRSAAGVSNASPELEALVQHVEITNDSTAVARRLTEHIVGASVNDLLSAPFVWIGTVGEIRDRIQEHWASLGLRRYVIRPPAIRAALSIIDMSHQRFPRGG